MIVVAKRGDEKEMRVKMAKVPTVANVLIFRWQTWDLQTMLAAIDAIPLIGDPW